MKVALNHRALQNKPITSYFCRTNKFAENFSKTHELIWTNLLKVAKISQKKDYKKHLLDWLF